MNMSIATCMLICVSSLVAVTLAMSVPSTPDLVFAPRPFSKSTLVRFMKSNGSTYDTYNDAITEQLESYENQFQQSENMIDCAAMAGPRPEADIDKVCRFDLIQLGSDCTKQWHYGYQDGMPCVLMQLDKIFDWTPQPYSNDTVPENIRDLWTEYAVTVKCDGETGADIDNMGSVNYYPSTGFDFKYFPYRNQPEYRPPLVFAMFSNPTPGILLMVTCRAYARNIHHSNTKMASVHFELLVD